MPKDPRAITQSLRDYAMSFPEAVEEFPWGHIAIKVRKKTFVFLHGDAEGMSVSAKLPESADVALMLPFASPTEYGLGKSGWVTGRFEAKQSVPEEVLRAWIEESYRALAPKKLTAVLAGTPFVEKSARKAAPKKAPARDAPPKGATTATPATKGRTSRAPSAPGAPGRRNTSVFRGPA